MGEQVSKHKLHRLDCYSIIYVPVKLMPAPGNGKKPRKIDYHYLNELVYYKNQIKGLFVPNTIRVVIENKEIA